MQLFYPPEHFIPCFFLLSALHLAPYIKVTVHFSSLIIAK